MEDKITRLSIKADRSGIAVYVPAHMSMDEICSELYRRFSHNACAFEKKGTIAVAFRGDAPTEAESHMIIDFLNDLDKNKLYVAECYATQGPTLKRIQPHAQGRAFKILKRTSHITLVLKEMED